MTEIIPIGGDRILVEPSYKEEDTMIEMEYSTLKKTTIGIIKYFTDNVATLEPKLQVGQTVQFFEHAFNNQIKILDKDYIVLRSSDIVCILK